MKKMWKPALACLLLVTAILAAMYLFREDKSPGPEGYGALERPPVSGDGPPGGRIPPGYPVSRASPLAPGTSSEPQRPLFSAQPGMTGGGQEDRPAHHPNGAMHQGEDLQPDAWPDEGVNDSEPPEQGSDQAPYEDGDPEEAPPDESRFEE